MSGNGGVDLAGRHFERRDFDREPSRTGRGGHRVAVRAARRAVSVVVDPAEQRRRPPDVEVVPLRRSDLVERDAERTTRQLLHDQVLRLGRARRLPAVQVEPHRVQLHPPVGTRRAPDCRRGESHLRRLDVLVRDSRPVVGGPPGVDDRILGERRGDLGERRDLR